MFRAVALREEHQIHYIEGLSELLKDCLFLAVFDHRRLLSNVFAESSLLLALELPRQIVVSLELADEDVTRVCVLLLVLLCVLLLIAGLVHQLLFELLVAEHLLDLLLQ